MSKADRIFYNGTILSLDEGNHIYGSLAVKDGMVIALGIENELEQWIGTETIITDLCGKTLLPGFYDSHSHLSTAGECYLYQVALTSPPVGEVTTIAQCIERLQQQEKDHPELPWILGWGYDHMLIAEQRHLTKADLDCVSQEKPVFVVHSSKHIAYANSAALQCFGYDAATPQPEGGTIHHDSETGALNGMLSGKAFRNVPVTMNTLTYEMKQKMILHSAALYAEQGVTTACDAGVSQLEILKAYQALAEQQILPVRVVVNPTIAAYEKWKEAAVEGPYFKIAGAKGYQDGSIQCYSASLSSPYYTPYQGDANYCGQANQTREALTEDILWLYAHQIQPVVHCNGDAAIDDYLDAIATAQQRYPQTDLRPVVIHCQNVRMDQLDLIQDLGAFPSFFVLHTYYWGNQHMDLYLGPVRGSQISPLHSALERGLHFSTHCDTVVTPQRPLLSVYAAVNRLSWQGRRIGSEERIDVLEALKTYTIYAAYQNHEENEKGSIELGKYADFVLLDKNPLQIAPEDIKEIKVLETIVGGNTVYHI